MKSGTIRGVRSSLILLLDLVVIVGVFSVIFYLRIGRLPNYQSVDLWLISTTFLLVLFLSGTYFREKSTKLPQLPVRTFWICIIAGAICIAWVYILGPSKFTQYFGRGVLPTATLVCGVITTLVRFLVNRIYHLQEQGFELLYLGFSSHGEIFLDELNSHSEVRSITIAAQHGNEGCNRGTRWVSTPIPSLLENKSWQTVIVDPEYETTPLETEKLVGLRLTGTPIVSLADFYEKYWFMIPVKGIDDDWFLRSQGFSVLDNPISRRLKRVLDILFSLILLIISSPVLTLCILLIKLTSRGPVFYRQQRVGFEGKPFTIIKLRTMQHNAEAAGAQWAQTNDPRVTFIGRILRDTRLDEIPQCWNVLKGEMSFVGPRPERPEFTKQLADEIPYYDLRHLVKPGITGWAQVIFPYGASVEDSLKKLQYELYYIKNQSLMLDLNIILRTMITMFQRAGR